MEALPKVCPRCGNRYDGVAAFCQRDGSPLVAFDEEPDTYIGQLLFDQFRIQERLGAGGMGTVYRARQTTVHRDVAIKILHKELIQNADAVRRFQREARVATALDHPNVVRVYLFGQLPDSNLYIVMEHLDGRSLQDLLRTEASLPVPRALHIAAQICDGVGEAHSRGVVHRDVKPENILLVERGRDSDFVKVLDFGIARFLWGEQTIATQSGLIFGTARYISPEGASGEETDARSDVYSIAVLTYQMLCGETPFESPSPVALLMKHIHEAAPDIRTRIGGGHVPAPIAEVLARALTKNADARYDDASALAQALREAARASGHALGPRKWPGSPSVVPDEPYVRPRAGGPVPGVGSWREGSAPHSVGRNDPVAGRSDAPSESAPWASRRAIVSRPLHAQSTPSAPYTPATPLHPDALSDAPSPYGNESGAVPALPRSHRRSTFVLSICAFLLGAAGVAAAAWYAGAIPTLRSDAPDVGALELQARAALRRGAIDSPPGDNVDDVTSHILEIEPGHRGALALREEAARRLRAEGAVAASQGYADEARTLYERSLSLASDREAHEAIARLARVEMALAQPARGAVRFVPSQPVVGAPVTLVAVLANGQRMPDGAEPHFHISRAGRDVAGHGVHASLAPDGKTYMATFVFPRPGDYAVSFAAHSGDSGDRRLEIRTEVTAIAAPSDPRASRRASVPPSTTQRPGHSHARDGDHSGADPSGSGARIDWNVPPVLGPAVSPTPDPGPAPTPTPDPPTETPPPPPPTDPTSTTPPPAPWTGGGSLL